VPDSLIDCCTPLVRSTLTDGQAAELEQVFKALADRTRVRILNLLASADEAVCVCALMPALELAQPTVSYHLRLLAEAGLLEREQRGRFAFYRIADGALERLGELVRSPAAAEVTAA
jgi:ArsR family transcriptional regulator, arsenate/arsenite/antimonite-responsive transcriptional repressor